MSEEQKKEFRVLFCKMLSEEIVEAYGVSKEVADNAVKGSGIQKVLSKYPDYVDHVSVYDWAREVYNEMIA